VSFTLHPTNYPAYLVPDNHSTFDAAGKSISLLFKGAEPKAELDSIKVVDADVPDIYLEPELVATLSRTGGDAPKEIREPLKFKDIPASVWQAIIAIEDQHFEDHAGFDPRGLARAIWVNLRTLSFAQGGSTLTQQLVKNLMVRRNKNVFRKINELFIAILLELRFDKEQILERYLNEVYLGQVGSLEIHGVAEGAKHFFGKKLTDLNLGEIALMAGLIRGPGYYSPYRYKERALERQQLVLKKMVETGQIAEAEAKAAAAMPIRLVPPIFAANKSPYFTDFVKAELIRQIKDKSEQEITAAGFRVYTTLDMAVNAAAQRSIAEGLQQVEKNLGIPATVRLEGALAAVDHSTGYIRALIGGRNYAQSTFNRILNMKRQIGSTFKPLVYLSAFVKGRDPKGIPYGPGHPVEDSPWKLVYDRGKQNWSPRNYEKEFMGWIPMRMALAHSVNIPAARLGIEVGLDNVIRTARAVGIQSNLPRVPSLSLGVAELSPVELLRAYATLANHGLQDELTVIRGITLEDGTNFARFIFHPQQVLEPGAVDLLTDMLQNVFLEGTARSAVRYGFDRAAAGKTGTTSNYRDSWFAGYTPTLTTVVWVGMDQDVAAAEAAAEAANNSTEQENRKKGKITLTGANAALPIWVSFMKQALEPVPPGPFPISSQVTATRIDRRSGKRASPSCAEEQTVVEKYVVGNEPQDTSCEELWPPSTPLTREDGV
jgi:penicillin-binding protein 1B